MPIHQLTPEEMLITRDTGFKIVNNFKLLGANITANSEDLSENFEPEIQKIVSLTH
jgi:hypothetical protein